MGASATFIAREISGETVWEIQLPDLETTACLAEIVARELKPGDLVTLVGDLGAGKTTLARAIIRTLAKTPDLEVPSPTFTILQHYETSRGQVIHADFYRLSDPSDLIELDWEDISETGISLVEWADKMTGGLNTTRMEIVLHLDAGTGARTAYVVGRGAFSQRVNMMAAVYNLLHNTQWEDAERVPVHGDASTRLYERLVRADGVTAILMISPPRPDGPPVRYGRSYSSIAKLAESVHAFVAVGRGLAALGLSAPRIYLKDLTTGLLVVEDLGNEPIIRDGEPIPTRYQEAVRVLTKIHRMDLPKTLPITSSSEYTLPVYDVDAMCAETELLLNWYIPYIRGYEVPGSSRAEFTHLWARALRPILEESVTWTLRDYHSPNLLWLEKREGLQRIGLIDFQDAVFGPPAYDLVSLLQDARVTVPAEMEIRLLAFYGHERHATDPDFDFRSFAETYAVMGAQRATKILGIFARLDKRDGKPQYLQHIPRLEAYLVRNLEHPALSGLKKWYINNMPHLFETLS
ncbi:MAG: tRNA (adenosine(37)-N6)-threonylcarbamoyltransferase complex ATPase subunit type 1 TsaE [Methylobacteriaceae bacterium]|jgi:tRNA threonylcarbamoyl adenosine modification protein YjeE|nr:tRNA (adenosine(37)-N6)-threonylcarbamoyltransferase complex ATPase subunit type 1 TsaE [Methylobacteriaceae bacterium]